MRTVEVVSELQLMVCTLSIVHVYAKVTLLLCTKPPLADVGFGQLEYYLVFILTTLIKHSERLCRGMGMDAETLRAFSVVVVAVG